MESRRVNGKPRQKILVHLGSYSSVDEALKRLPYDVGSFRRSGYAEMADKLQARLERLKELRAGGVA